MSEKMKFGRSKGFMEKFTRRPGPNKTNMHYCPGCGHGILHKLIAEAIEDLEIKDRTVLISPVGCSVFAYYYFDCFGISVPHGRAPAIGTGISRACSDNLVISYQGDGDLGAIGFNEFIQSANRGENMVVIFVNNAIYGMTGGQMAPTTLPGQKTLTCPEGRSVWNDGYPLKVSEITSQLDAPIYVERVALSTNAHIQKARRAIRKALTNLRDKKGFSLVECLSGCPVNLKKSASEMNEFIDGQMTRFFPIKVFKDVAEERNPLSRPEAIQDVEMVKRLLYPVPPRRGVGKEFRNPSEIFRRERRIKVAGFGGQGVLSLGFMIATMARLRNFNVSYLPSYGPEMRGGTACCSIVISRDPIGSPVVDKECNLLIALNQPSLDKYFSELKPHGVLLYDSSNATPMGDTGRGLICSSRAGGIAERMGNLKFANSAMLGAFYALMSSNFLEGDDKADFERAFEEAIMECFNDKKNVIQGNVSAFYAGREQAIINPVD